MDLFTYLLGKNGKNTHRDLFSYLLGKNAGGSGTYTTFSGTSLNISNTLQAKIKSISLEGNASQDGTPTPDTPIPIKVVTGEQNVEISGKNKLNLYEHTNTLASNTIIINSNNYKCEATGTWQGEILLSFDNLKANTNYTFSADTSEASRFIVTYVRGIKNGEYTTLISNIYGDFLPIRFNTSDYERINIRMYARGNGGSSGTVIVKNIQLEESSTATEFVPYSTPQTYPISLGSIELAKIGNYKDYIFKNVVGSPYYNANLDLNGWYLHKEIIGENLWEKDWVYESESSTPVPRTVLRLRNMSTIRVYFSNCFLSSEMNNQQIVNRLKTDSPNWFLTSANNLTGIETTDSNNIKLNKITTFLQSISANIYYRLITPTNTKITDTTLIQQLENINNNARSYKDTTIITCSSESEDNETIGFSGDIKVTRVGLGNSLNTSLLSQNINDIQNEEEPNLDDIQEEPNLDDVNEIENIEQNDEPIENEEIEELIEKEVS